jgi:hypothetical protein
LYEHSKDEFKLDMRKLNDLSTLDLTGCGLINLVFSMDEIKMSDLNIYVDLEHLDTYENV